MSCGRLIAFYPIRGYAALASHLHAPVHMIQLPDRESIRVDAQHATKIRVPLGAIPSRDPASNFYSHAVACAGARYLLHIDIVARTAHEWPRIVVRGFEIARSRRAVCSFLSSLKRPWMLATTKSNLPRTPAGISFRSHCHSVAALGRPTATDRTSRPSFLYPPWLVRRAAERRPPACHMPGRRTAVQCRTVLGDPSSDWLRGGWSGCIGNRCRRRLRETRRSPASRRR
jgi:hypothetical protein